MNIVFFFAFTQKVCASKGKGRDLGCIYIIKCTFGKDNYALPFCNIFSMLIISKNITSHSFSLLLYIIVLALENNPFVKQFL